MGGAPRARDGAAAAARLTPALLVLLGGAQAALLVALLAPLWAAAIPLVVALLLAALGGAWARTRLFGPVVARGARTAPSVGLLFDLPAAAIRPLLGGLDLAGIRAAFAVRAVDVTRDPELVDAILAAGHELVASTADGAPTLPFSLPRAARARVLGTFRALERRGGPTTRAYLPPRGLTHPSVRPALLEVGAFLLLPRRCWGGRGPAPVAGLVRGDVLLVTTAEAAALTELAASLGARGLEPRPLSAVLERPVLGDHIVSPVAAFYDGLAAHYDAEQARAGASPARRAEAALVEAWLAELVRPGLRALELGAGTGRFTERLAALGARVTAVDLSPEMLARLRDRLDRRGLRDVTLVEGDFLEAEVGSDYDLVCSFSAFEYVADLDRLLAAVTARLAPGGRLFFTTARRGLLRAFVQLGNALRQGVWLTARSEPELRSALARAGLACERIESVGLKLGRRGGLLVAVVARKGG